MHSAFSCGHKSSDSPSQRIHVLSCASPDRLKVGGFDGLDRPQLSFVFFLACRLDRIELSFHDCMSDEQTPKQDHIPLYQPYRFAAPPAQPAAAPEPGTGRVQVHPFPELQAQAFIDMAPPSGSTSDQSSAAGSSSRDAASSGSASAGASTAATSSRRNQAPKLIVGQQYSDKSCKACR